MNTGKTAATIESLRNNFGTIDYSVFIAFLMASASIGVFFGWKSRNNKSNKEFLTGNRNLQMFPVVMSLASSFMSTNTMLGVPAEVYLLGTQFVVNMICFVVAVVLSAEVFMPVFYNLNMISINEYLFLRFRSNNTRLVGSLAFITCTLPYLAVVLYGPSVALASVTSLPVTYSVLVVGVICTFYTAIGGVKAVIWTDVMQCILMMLGVAMIAGYSFFDVGGWMQPFRTASRYGRLKWLDMDPNPYRSDTFLPTFSGTLVVWCGMYCISQTEVQRFCSTKSASHAKRTLYWNIPPVLFIGWMAIWGGLVVFNRYYQCDPVSMGILQRHDQLIPYFVMDTMSHVPGVAGLFTACIFSGSLSTLSSGFNSLAAITWEDFLSHRFKSKKLHDGANVTHITKGIAASCGLISLVLAFFVGRLGTVLQASLAISGSCRGPLLALFCMGLFMPFTNSRGAISGTIAGILSSLFLAIGSIIRPRPKEQLELFTNNCSSSIYEAYGHPEPQQHMPPWLYHPAGVDRVLHLSYFYVAVIGFTFTLLVGIIVSLATSNQGEEAVHPKYLSKYHLPYFRNKLGQYDVAGSFPLETRM